MPTDVVRLSEIDDAADIERIWAGLLLANRADVPRPANVIGRIASGNALVVEHQPGPITGAMGWRKSQTADGVILRLDPFLPEGEEAERALFQWAATKPTSATNQAAVRIWLPGDGPWLVADYGFTHVRTFLRLDRALLVDVQPSPLPADLVVIDANDALFNLQDWTDMYNSAFAGEWEHWQSSAFDMHNFVISSPTFCLAALDQGTNPVVLALCHLETLAHDARAQPVADVVILCVASRRRKEGIGESMLREAMIRLRTAGARSATIRADMGSRYESYRLYEGVGFQKALEFRIWERSTP